MDEQDQQELWIASQHREHNVFTDLRIRAAGMTPAEWFRRSTDSPGVRSPKHTTR